MPTKITLIFDIAKLFSKKRNTKTTGKCHIPYSHARGSSAIGDERTDIDDGCTGTDDERTDVGDGGTFPHEPCTNGGRTLKEWWSDFEGMTQKNCRYDT